MKTYQDFIKELGKADQNAIHMFLLAAISEYKTSDTYLGAVDAEAYYCTENPTITKYEKIIYDMQGKAHADMWTANHKIASSFFGLVVDQAVGYLLGNGINFSDASVKDRLGNRKYPFDQQVAELAREMLIGGVAYGLWNMDHIDIFSAREFVPLLDEENGALCAGIRFWQIDSQKPLRMTLYEMDGYTDYIQMPGKAVKQMTEKLPYKQFVRTSPADGTIIYGGENYPSFPIVPMRNGKMGYSEIKGKKNTIDAYDLARSGMCNNVDEGNLIYWVLTNAGGMDDLDDQKFLERLKTTHVVHVDGVDGATAEPHSIEAPFTGTSATIDMLRKSLYEDFQAFDSSAVTAENQTATAIKASYVPLDMKCDKIERDVTRFINGILDLAGIDDAPTYTRNKIINSNEEVQTVILAAQYLDSEYITRKILNILGDTDQADTVVKRMIDGEIARFKSGSPADPGQQAENSPAPGDGALPRA